jgi:type IV pilus modification protein PilV
LKEAVVRRIYKVCRNKSGFTLIEGLIAIAILAFGLLAVVTMLDVGFNAGALSKNMTTSTELAAYMMDRIRFESASQTDGLKADRPKLLSFNGLDTALAAPATSPANNAFAPWQQLVQQNLRNGQGTVTIVQNPDPALSLHFTVTVQVTWGAPLTRRVALTSQMIVSI